MRPQWFITDCHRWKWKLLVLFFLFFVPKIHGQSCPTDFEDVSNDPSQTRCAFVSTAVALTASFPVARFNCQSLDPRSDLIALLSSDNVDRENLPNFEDGMDYYIGLTDTFNPSTSAAVNVADCTDYNSQTQPAMLGNACGSGTCNCWSFVAGAMNTGINQRNCLTEMFRYICGIFDDFPTCMCPQGWQWIRDRCYRYYTGHSAANFDEAEAVCMAGGGNLARANFYDCNYAGILGRRPDTSLTYLVGLRGAVGSEQWRDGTTPGEIFEAGVGECFLLGDNTVSAQLQRVGCTVFAPNFICERGCTFESTVAIQTTGQSTEGPGSTAEPPSTGGLPSTRDPVMSTGVSVSTGVTVTTDDGVATTDFQPTTDGGCCSVGTTAIGDNCFAIITTVETYDNANTLCSQLGGVLARVNPPAEVNQFIVDFFNGEGSQVSSVWIGLRRVAGNPVTYIWEADSTELLVTEAFWDSQQPAGAVGFDCVIAVNSAGIEGSWFLTSCFSESAYLCQFEMQMECVADPCNPTPCDNSGPGTITCSTPGFGIAQCSCGTGFELEFPNGPCININECLQNPCDPVTEDCVDTTGSFLCECRSGLMDDPLNPGTCIPIDLCEGVVCTPGPGNIFCSASGNCECVDAGFQLQLANGPCIDTNECSANPPPCDTTSQDCTNTVGSFECNCKEGFEPNPDSTQENCLPIVDPCVPNPCTAGTFGVIQCNAISGACECPNGYTLTTSTGPCADVNECLTNNGGCDVTSTTCMNTQGSFFCQCRDGFQNLGLSNACSDINECLTNNGGCDVTSTTCMNTQGSFFCQCRDGFQNLGLSNACSNINECLNANDNDCDLTTTFCQDNTGSFSCECLGDRVRVSSTTCTDECTLNVDGCDDASTTCVADVNGGAVCECREGFEPITGNPLACQLIDAGICCPVSMDARGNDRIISTGGRCVYFDINAFDTFDDFDSFRCATLVSTIGETGGRLLELSVVTTLDSVALTNLVEDQFLVPLAFPSILYIDLRRATTVSNFQWGDAAQTILPSNSPLWIANSPQASTSESDLNCGSITSTVTEFGYTNVDCNSQARAFCSLDPIPCTQGLTARVITRVTSVNGEEATFTEPIANKDSADFKRFGNRICDAMIKALEDPSRCRLSATSNGSIIAYLEVTIPRPNKIRNYDQMKKALMPGTLDENGYVTLYTSDGTGITIDPNSIDVDDKANHQCRTSTCQNGGTCSYNDRFIEANCQCMEGFRGTRCETIRDDSNTRLLVVLSLLAVVLLCVFTCCFCCVCVFSRRQNQNRKIFKYQPPATVPESFMMPAGLSKQYGMQRKYMDAASDTDGEFGLSINFPRVIRNRAVDRAVEMQEYDHDNNGFEPDDYDVESSIDDKRMDHFKKVFFNANQLNSHMSSRGDSASSISSGTSIVKRPLSDMLDPIDERHEFDRPYTTDGTENI